MSQPRKADAIRAPVPSSPDQLSSARTRPGAAGWSVGVAHPRTGATDHLFVLRDSAVGTSGNGEQSHLLDLIRVGHMIDARRGKPADGHLSASVQARSGVESDYLSTVAYLLGPDRFHGWPEALATHFVG